MGFPQRIWIGDFDLSFQDGARSGKQEYVRADILADADGRAHDETARCAQLAAERDALNQRVERYDEKLRTAKRTLERIYQDLGLPDGRVGPGTYALLLSTREALAGSGEGS